MVFQATFNSISVVSHGPLTCLSWVSPVHGWGSEVSCPRTVPRKTQRIQYGSKPEPLDYESNTLLPRHAGPLSDQSLKHWSVGKKISYEQPLFLYAFSTSPLKTLWEKTELLVKSNFSFSPSVFKSFGEFSDIFFGSKSVICKIFKFQKL